MARRRETRNGKSTDAKILETATRLFAEKGYHGTSVDEIVGRAGVNKRMVYHYFGSKLGLYQRVMTAAYAELARFEEQGLESVQEFGEVVERLIEIGFEFSETHPKFTRLILWENLNKGRGILSADAPLSKEPLLKKLRDAIAAAPEGKYERIDPRYLFLMIVGLTQIFVSNRYTLSQGLGLDLGSPEVRRRGLRNAVHFMLAGLQVEAQSAAP